MLIRFLCSLSVADWNELFTTKCVSCGFPIEAGDRWVEALNNNYHSQCFNCTVSYREKFDLPDINNYFSLTLIQKSPFPTHLRLGD